MSEAASIDRDAANAGENQTERSGSRWLRYAPIALIAIGAAAAFMAFGDYLSFDTLRDNREALLAWRDGNYVLAAGAFVLAYTLVVALSIPGALWMTLGGGFLFGVVGGSLLTVVAATIGATAIFLAARTSLGEALRAKAGPWLQKLEGGVRENEVSYMLLLRLVPAVPFFIANLAPAFLGVRLTTYVWTTFLGILPATAVYSWVGAGLGDVLDKGGEPNLGLLFEPHIIGPLLGIAALAALPILIKAFRGRSGDDAAADQKEG